MKGEAKNLLTFINLTLFLLLVQTELEIARKSGDRVIVAGHHPLGKGCARTLHYAWNAEEVER